MDCFNKKNEIDLFTLPFKSQFKYLQFNGLADGTPLVPNFDPASIVGRDLILKAVRIVAYNDSPQVDLFLTDGVTTNSETIPANARINRLFDSFGDGTELLININGSIIPVFQNFTPFVPPLVGGNVPLDLDIDNIFYQYGAKIVSLNVSVNTLIFNDIITPTQDIPNVKVFLQCYLI